VFYEVFLMGKKLYVGNLPFSITEERVGEVFGQIGQIESIRIVIDRDTGRSKGFGFVEMASDDEAQSAIDQLHGAELDGRTLVVNEARPMEPRGDRGGFGAPRGGGGGGFGAPRTGDRNGGGGGDRGFPPRRPRY
jgi:RNA recognition motif-containing protein